MNIEIQKNECQERVHMRNTSYKMKMNGTPRHMQTFYGPTPPTRKLYGPTQFFLPTPKFNEPTPLMSPTPPTNLRSHTTYATTLPTPLTLFSRLELRTQ